MEAASHYGQALQHALKLETDSQSLQHLYGRRGRALEMNGQYEEALANYQEMITLAQERGDRPMELVGLVALATLYAAPTVKYDPIVAERLSQEALVLAQALGDVQMEAKIYWNRMLLELNENPELAVRYGETSLAIARRYNLREQMAYTLNDLFRAYLGVGQPEKSWPILKEAEMLWRELDNKGMLADNLASSTFYYLVSDDTERVAAAAEEAIAISELIGNLWGQSYGRFALGLAYWLKGDWGKSIPTMIECVRLGEQAGFILATVEVGSYLAATYGFLGAYEQAYEWANRVLSKAETMPSAYRTEVSGLFAYLDLLQGKRPKSAEWLGRGEVETPLGLGLFFNFAARCEVHLADERYEEALALAVRGGEEANRSLIYPLLSLALYYQGRALMGLGRVEEAAVILAEARRVTTERAVRPSLWLILLALAELENGRGNGEGAAELRQQARGVIEYIMDSLDDPELRRAFRETAAVQAAFN
jgi:tetratricopeptide (TPR) repeat protein